MDIIAQRVCTSLFTGLIFLSAYLFFPFGFAGLLIGILFVILLVEWPRLFPPTSLRFWLIMPFYPILPVACLLYLHSVYYHVHMLIPLYPYGAAWTVDIGSFFIGMFFGKHKICPQISPGKSWEGLAGGFVALLLLNSFLVLTRLGILYTVAVSAVLTVLDLMGDLLISYFKRRAGLKDSGSILPGHGGFLDRFDGVFFVAVAVVLGLLFYH